MYLLEQAILNRVGDLVKDLEIALKDTSGEFDKADINAISSSIFSLVDLKDVENNGMSESLKRGLQQLNVRTLYLLRSR